MVKQKFTDDQLECFKQFPAGIEFIRSTEGLWNGNGWVRGWVNAKKYRPCTLTADADAALIEKETGISCSVSYLTSPSVGDRP